MQRNENKLFRRYGSCIFDCDYKKESTQGNWVDSGPEFVGELKKLCKAEAKKFYSTLSATKASFAERTIRSSKSILYRYMENFGNKCIHNMNQFVKTLKPGRIFLIDLIQKNAKNSDFLSILYSKALQKLGKLKFVIGERVCISKYNLPFRKDYKPQFTNEVFKYVAISSRNLPTSTINDERDGTFCGKMYQKI